jgi:hypothetical protein
MLERTAVNKKGKRNPPAIQALNISRKEQR